MTEFLQYIVVPYAINTIYCVLNVGYGPINTNSHYYAPRTELIDFTCRQLLGKNPYEDGHYITVWEPRQTGKSGTLKEALFRLRENKQFDRLLRNA
jgi:hypothetical protein